MTTSRNAHINDLITQAFDSFIADISESGLGETLFEVAINAKRHENTVRDGFATMLGNLSQQSLWVRNEMRLDGLSNHPYDIGLGNSSGPLGVIEVKAPMTNHDGVRHKTRRMPEDCDYLREAVDKLEVSAYELVTLIECYGLGSDGKIVISNGRSIRQNEREISSQYGIKWPTRHDYLPEVGENEVDGTLTEHHLERIKGWNRVKLPASKAPQIAFIDCALFRL